MYVSTEEPVNIENLGTVLITGIVNAKCDLWADGMTIITEVKFWYSDNDSTIARPELWRKFEHSLCDALERFGVIEKQFKYDL